MPDSRPPHTVPPGGLTIEHGPEGLQLVGELDTASAPQLGAALRAAADLPVVVVELDGLTFIDSSGLRLLIEAHQSLDREGRRLVLRRPSRSVLRLLEISGVDGYLNLEA